MSRDDSPRYGDENVTSSDRHEGRTEVRGTADTERIDPNPDTRNEAQGVERENIGNNSRSTDTDPIGPEGNDRTRGRAGEDEFDQTLGDRTQ